MNLRIINPLHSNQNFDNFFYVVGSGNVGILPPPPGSGAIPRVAGPPSVAASRPVAAVNTSIPSFQPAAPANVPASNPPSDWGDFTTASTSNQP